MTRGRARVHLNSDKGLPHTARCGWQWVDMTSDVSIVTCKSCLTALAMARTGATPRSSGKRPASAEDVQAGLRAAFMATLAPTAPAPPRVTAALWASSCKGGEHRRCGECELCLWEREAQLWAAVSPWNKRHEIERALDAPRWSSLSAALLALVEFERHDRSSPSALGGILDRCKRGAAGDTSERTRVDDPLLRRAGELVRVRQALELAYPEGAHVVPAAKCRAILLLRTPGIVGEMPTFEALAVLFNISVGDLQALVKNGRKRVGDELAARGIIPPQRTVFRGVVAATWYAQAAE
jgi:hypothetical protein